MNSVIHNSQEEYLPGEDHDAQLYTIVLAEGDTHILNMVPIRIEKIFIHQTKDSFCKETCVRMATATQCHFIKAKTKSSSDMLTETSTS